MPCASEWAAQPVDYLLVKLASRCNLNCTYCYWFRDEAVRQGPNRLTPDAQSKFIERLFEHIKCYQLKRFSILFHGGEPMLFGKERFAQFAEQLGDVAERTGCKIPLQITTNATLIDQEWARLFLRHQVGVTVSLDGPRRINDLTRPLLSGNSSFDAVLSGIDALRSSGINPGALAVYSPGMDALETIEFFVKLGLPGFNVLIPDSTHETPEHTATVSPFFTDLFELWWSRFREQGVRISFCDNLIKGLVTGHTGTESFGYGPMTTATLMPNGDIEPLDVTRIAGEGSTSTNVSVLRHSIQSIRQDPRWLGLLEASLTLHSTCEQCQFRSACGGGHVASRWSEARKYDNPSVYCDEFKVIFSSVWRRIYPALSLVAKDA